MKLNEYFRTPRGYKRLGIWSAVVLLTIPVMRPITFLLHYVTESTSKVVTFSLWIAAAFLVLWLVSAILKWSNMRPVKRFPLFCAGTAVAIYMVYAFSFYMCICYKPTKLGAVAVQGTHALYNPIGWRIAKWDKPYMYVSEFYNTHLRERCYVALYANSYGWKDATGLMEIDMFTKDWEPLDHCAVMLEQSGEGTMELRYFLGEAIGVEGKMLFSTNHYNSWKKFTEEYDVEYIPSCDCGYQFETYTHEPIQAFGHDYNGGLYYGWADKDFYDEDHHLVGRSFKHLPVRVLNHPTYMEKHMGELAVTK